MNAFLAAATRLLARARRERAVRVVDQAPLYGGSAVHVVDVGQSRIIFATSARAICLLAVHDAPVPGGARKEGAGPVADTL